MSKKIMGMIHCSGTVKDAINEIAIYQEEDVDAIIIENYHGGVRDVIDVLKELRKHKFTIEVGINILPNDYLEALMLANTYGASFIQLDFISGIYQNDIKLNTEEFKKVRQHYSNIKVLGGVWPKYYNPIVGSDFEADLKEGMKLADGIVITGTGTGKETPLDKIKEARSTIGNFPLIIGAGLDSSNVSEQLPFADGAIVGSCFKRFKRTQDLINRELVREFMDEVKKLR